MYVCVCVSHGMARHGRLSLALSEPVHSLCSLQDGDPGDMPPTKANAMLFDR